MDDRKPSSVVQGFERCKPRVQPEEAVEIESGIRAGAGRRYRDARTGPVVRVLSERHDHVQPVDRAALKDGHQDLAPRGVRRRHGPRKERRREAEADERQAAILEEDAS